MSRFVFAAAKFIFFIGKKLVDGAVTVILWVYFVLFGLTFAFPAMIFVRLFHRNVEYGFQKIHRRFCQVFFYILKTLGPGVSISISDEVSNLRSTIIVCNHLSYLDPILLISLFEKHITIVKPVFFKVPLFGWTIDNAGHIPAKLWNKADKRMIDRIQHLKNYLDKGGILFIFPEGTRSRNGKLGDFEVGAFKLAKRTGCPVDVLEIENTEKIFRPGRFFLQTCEKRVIKLKKIGRIGPFQRFDRSKSPSPRELAEHAKKMYIND